MSDSHRRVYNVDLKSGRGLLIFSHYRTEGSYVKPESAVPSLTMKWAMWKVVSMAEGV